MTEWAILRRPLDSELTPAEMLRVFRNRERLVGLIGDWAGGGAVIAFDPIRQTQRVADIHGAPCEFAVGDDLPGAEGDVLVGGGWFGILGYQLGGALEELPPAPSRVFARPDCDLAFHDHVIRYLKNSRRWVFEGLRGPDPQRLEDTYRDIVAAIDAGPPPAPREFRCGPFSSTPSLWEHREVVRTVLRHIEAGDIFQANACLRLAATFAGDPLDLFLAGIEALQPAYAAFVRTEGGAVASLSPELFLERRGRDVRTAPIKGTAPLHNDPRVLEASRKDRAENLMIVDLMRNDLSRTCEPGSVQVAETPMVREHAGVWHLVSEVTGRLRPEIDNVNLIQTTFPPGSVTGAPKISAMGVINAVEATARETYTGAIGWIGHSALELNVAIRTFEFTEGSIWLGVGGGVVAESVPEREVEECFVKAVPLLRAVGADLAVDLGHARDELAAHMSRETSTYTSTPEVRRRHNGCIHVLDDRVIVDWGRHPAPGGAALVDVLLSSGLPVEIRAPAPRELLEVRECFGFDDIGRPASIGDVSRRSKVGPMQRWLEDALTASAERRPLARAGTGDLGPSDIRVLIVDHYDSFVFNLARYCSEAGAEVDVVRSDRFDPTTVVRETHEGRWNRLLLSPGPGDPRDRGHGITLLQGLPPEVPVLGVCLGHQAIGLAFDGKVVSAPRPVHGRHAIVHHDGTGVFTGLGGPILGARYHSLVVEEASLAHTPLRVTARTPSGVVMGVRHRNRPIEGVQIHPESVLTPHGHRLIRNFLTQAVRQGTRADASPTQHDLRKRPEYVT